MDSRNIAQLQEQYPDITILSGGISGLYYGLDEERNKIVIFGEKGKVLLSKGQAIVLVKELKSMVNTYLNSNQSKNQSGIKQIESVNRQALRTGLSYGKYMSLRKELRNENGTNF